MTSSDDAPSNDAPVGDAPAAAAPASAPAEEAPPEGGGDVPESSWLYERFGRPFKAGDVLFREGEIGTEAYLLEEGRIRLIKKVRGVDRNLMVLKPGDLFGESALIVGTARSSTAVALSSGLALALDQGTLQNLLEHNPAVAARWCSSSCAGSATPRTRSRS